MASSRGYGCNVLSHLRHNGQSRGHVPAEQAQGSRRTCSSVRVAGIDKTIAPWDFSYARDVLSRLFSNYGYITHIDILEQDNEYVPPRRLACPEHAVVHYSTPKEALAAVQKLNGHYADGQALTVQMANEQEVPQASNSLFVSGFPEAEWSFKQAEDYLTQWFQGGGYSVQSVEVCDVTERGHRLPHAYFAFVRLSSVEEARRAIQHLNGQELYFKKMIVKFRKEGPAAAPPDPAVATQLGFTHSRHN